MPVPELRDRRLLRPKKFEVYEKFNAKWNLAEKKKVLQAVKKYVHHYYMCICHEALSCVEVSYAAKVENSIYVSKMLLVDKIVTCTCWTQFTFKKFLPCFVEIKPCKSDKITKTPCNKITLDMLCNFLRRVIVRSNRLQTSFSKLGQQWVIHLFIIFNLATTELVQSMQNDELHIPSKHIIIQLYLPLFATWQCCQYLKLTYDK